MWQPEPSLLCRPSTFLGSNKDAQGDVDTDFWHPYLSSAGAFSPILSLSKCGDSQSPWDGCLRGTCKPLTKAELRTVVSRRNISFCWDSAASQSSSALCVCGFPSYLCLREEKEAQRVHLSVLRHSQRAAVKMHLVWMQRRGVMFGCKDHKLLQLYCKDLGWEGQADET